MSLNWFYVFEVNKELLSALEDCNDCIGKVFLELAPFLNVYKQYVSRKTSLSINCFHIFQVNKELLSALEDCNDCIGKVFLELAPYLKFYSTYANDFEAAVKLVERWSSKNKTFR
jgi:hypothetical protein